MEVKIGVQHATREIVIDSDLTSEALEAEVTKAIAGETTLLVLTDSKGRRVLVPSAKLAFVEVGSPAVGQVGFRS